MDSCLNMNGGPSYLAFPPQQRGVRLSARLRERDILFQVWDNPSLREGILKHAIMGSIGVERSVACNLRLVQSSWNESVARILWKEKTHLYKVILGGYGDNCGRAVKTFGSALWLSAGGPICPLRFEIVGGVHSTERMEDISNFLTRCGSSIVQLELFMPEFVKPIKGMTVDLSCKLPRLDQLQITVSRGIGFTFTLSEYAGEVSVLPENVTACLINSILNGATNVTEMVVVGRRIPFQNQRPAMQLFSHLTLLPNLTKLKIKGEMTHDDVEYLSLTSPSKLTSLTLKFGTNFLENGLLGRIIDSSKCTLKYLAVTEDHYNGLPYNPIWLSFPKMEQLVELSITSVNAQLVKPKELSLPMCFPKLRTLRLRHQTESTLKNWTRNGLDQFMGVSSLELLLADQNKSQENLNNFLIGTSAEIMMMVNIGFPNLRQLELGVSKEETSGLEYVFSEMMHLTELKIIVCSVKSETSPNVWDSILTGTKRRIPRRYPNLIAQGNCAEETISSINNLKDLIRFSLEDCRRYSENMCEKLAVPKPYFSDYTFTQALLKMPKLKYVCAPFVASKETLRQWQNEGRRYWFY